MFEFLQQRSRRKRFAASACLAAADLLESRQLLSATTVQLGVSQDNSIYQADVNASNGAGEYLPVSQGVRSLLQFAVDSIPSGSTVIDAVLTLNAVDGESGDSAVSLHAVQSAWGESGSNALGNELEGASAQEFDATWIYSSFDGESWASPGGDIAGSSATTTVSGSGYYEWVGSQLIDDVQAWIDDPGLNFGWLLQTSGSWKSFISGDAPDSGLGPTLEVTFEAPPAPPIAFEGRLWNDLNHNGRRDNSELSELELSILNGNSYFNAFGGEEFWFWSRSEGSWYFLTPNGELTNWSGQGLTLAGTTFGTIDTVFYQNPSLLTQTSDGSTEPWLNGWTVEAINEDGDVVSTTTTDGRDINGDDQISADEWGWYFFELPGDSEYTIRAVEPNGWSKTGQLNFASNSGGTAGVNEPQLAFRVSFYENYGGLNEKWMWSSENGWYYITPSGDLYRWNGIQPSETAPLTGRLVASPGVAFYEDPLRLTEGGYSSPEEPEETIQRTDVGLGRSVTVRGRSYLDFNQNGYRDLTDLFDARFANTLYPDDQLESGEQWYLDTELMHWYLISPDGVPEFHSPAPAGPAWSTNVVGGVQAEPWLNGRTMELVDADGRVVETTQTRSIDLDEDGEINVELERGWYVFENVAAGEYTVRMRAEAGWVNEYYGGSEADNVAAQLNAEYNFRQTVNDFHNWGGRNERWIIDQSNQWFFILEDGSLFEWDKGTGRDDELVGTLVGTMSPEYYADLSLITSPPQSGQRISVSHAEDPLELIFSSHRLLDQLRAI